MPDPAEITLDEIYAEVQKRIDALKAELLAKIAELEARLPEKTERLTILRKRGA